MNDVEKLNQKSKRIYNEILGVSPKIYIKNGKVLNLFDMVNVLPYEKVNGRRNLTPYEILGVAPIFDLNGNEKPIVFAVKNKVSKVTKNTTLGCGFIYQANKVKSDKNLLESMASKYKKAVLYGNDSDAEMYFKMLDDISGGKAREILSSFYDYSKFYRRMKKQLLIDIFAHFFLVYVSTKKSLIKNGIINKNKIFRAYHEEYAETKTDVYEFDIPNLNFGLDEPVLQSIKITTENDFSQQPEVQNNNEKEIQTKSEKFSDFAKKDKPKRNLVTSVINKPKKIKIRKFKEIAIDKSYDNANTKKDERIKNEKTYWF